MFDFTKTSSRLLVDLINEDNGTQFHPSTVLFSNVTTLESGSKNTQVLLSGAPDSGYDDSVSLTYDRVPVSGFVGSIELVYLVQSQATISDLLPLINETLNINLTDEEIQDGPLPSLGSQPNSLEDVDVVMVPQCLVYTGTLTVQITNGEISLQSIITNTELSGFYIESQTPIRARMESANGLPLEGSGGNYSHTSPGVAVLSYTEEDTVEDYEIFVENATLQWANDTWSIAITLRAPYNGFANAELQRLVDSANAEDLLSTYMLGSENFLDILSTTGDVENISEDDELVGVRLLIQAQIPAPTANGSELDTLPQIDFVFYFSPEA